MASAPMPPNLSTGVLPMEQVEKLLPTAVYFRGQTAPLQLRNSAAYRVAGGGIVWAGLVDTSGYSTSVREKYQFYFVTEIPLTAGTLKIAPGVYGGGFLTDNTFVLLDVAGAEVGRASVVVDGGLRRPRPLQMVADGDGLRLYVGKQYLALMLR